METKFILSYLPTNNFWRNVFTTDEILCTELKKICDYLENEIIDGKTIYPPLENIFKVFIDIPRIQDIKIVLLGQDPYHDGSATGLAFDIVKNKKIPPSLRNIYEELKREDYKDCDISKWSKQGVFLLNTALSVRKGCPNSHSHIWNKFILRVLEIILEPNNNIIWILLGKNAENIYNQIKQNKNNELVFSSSHPSPFSYKSTNKPFYGSNIFKNVNDKLITLNKEIINW